jgi:hypothetical protein
MHPSSPPYQSPPAKLLKNFPPKAAITMLSELHQNETRQIKNSVTF